MGHSELAIESVAAEAFGILSSLPPGTMTIVNSVFSDSGRNQTQQRNRSSNSEKEFWSMVGYGIGGALAGAAGSPQSSPTWQSALSGAGSGLQTWAERQSGGSIDDEIYYDHKVDLNGQREELAYITSSRSFADTHSNSYSSRNIQQSLSVGEKTVLAANDLRTRGYYPSNQFNDLVETALTGHQNEQARAIKKVGADLEYYREF